MITIEDLKNIETYINNKWGRKSYKEINYCGLIPVSTDFITYDSTPINVKTFAITEGNGVHFSQVLLNQSDENIMPVVITVPMADKNIIIAENLDEFLGLGYYNGWFSLEHLAYDIEDTLKYYSIPDPELTPQEYAFLQLLKDQLNIKHYNLTKERLNYLKDKYYNLIDFF